jgi:hypothetical protein
MGLRFPHITQMNETMGGNIGALRAVLKETSAEITSTHNLSHALVQNQRRCVPPL